MVSVSILDYLLIEEKGQGEETRGVLRNIEGERGREEKKGIGKNRAENDEEAA